MECPSCPQLKVTNSLLILYNVIWKACLVVLAAVLQVWRKILQLLFKRANESQLSRECREEMKYYKLLAKEVEKRITTLKPFITESADVNNVDIPTIYEDELFEKGVKVFDYETPTLESEKPCLTQDPVSKMMGGMDPVEPIGILNKKETLFNAYNMNEPDLKVDIEEDDEFEKCPLQITLSIELPERDCPKQVENEVLLENNIRKLDKPNNLIEKNVAKPMLDFITNGLPLKVKSFTGSLNNLHIECLKESQKVPPMIRQRSYTLLTPSPQLLAHLEVQSMNTGIDVSAISMSESKSSLFMKNKKRRSWDLESAKAKWSVMAKELKDTDSKHKVKAAVSNTGRLVSNRKGTEKAKKSAPEPRRQAERQRHTSLTREPWSRAQPSSPARSACSQPVSAPAPAKPTRKEPTKQPSPEDPATCIKQLYEKIQKQQAEQMASLIEKQKREQELLQKAFAEQNNMLFNQLKTICPKSPVEVKEAWAEDADRGPVSLSQLIHPKPPDKPCNGTPTKTNTTKKKQHDSEPRAQRENPRTSSPVTPKIAINSRTRTNSPNRSHRRRLNYDTSSDHETMFTDRTNDTLADLNVTFPSDSEDSFNQSLLRKPADLTVIHRPEDDPASSTDSAIRSMEITIQNSINAMAARSRTGQTPPTLKEREAATKIVAHARGYLVRRLMRTERVQGTVQTIRDALLCALQLHQDREGIRGADVDLHRRLIQQITAACYSLHDTFITSSPAERAAVIAADRARRNAAPRGPPALKRRSTISGDKDLMSQSHSAVTARLRPAPSLMSQSHTDYYNSEKSRPRHMPSPRRSPWR